MNNVAKVEVLPKSSKNLAKSDHLTKQVAQHFNHSATTYHLGAQLQRDVALDLLNDFLDISKGNVKYSVGLDLGSGPGLFTSTIQQLTTDLISVDLCGQMLKQNTAADILVQADSHHLPFLDNSFDLVYSSLMIQWCKMPMVLAEVFRVLKPGGKAVISTLVDGTLAELQQAWSKVDNDKHIHDYLSFEQVQQFCSSQPWSNCHLSEKKRTYYFSSAVELAKELKALGANLVKSRKNKGMITKSKWMKMEKAYQAATGSGKLPATYQLVYLELTK